MLPLPCQRPGTHCRPLEPASHSLLPGPPTDYRHHGSPEVVRGSSWRLSVSVTVSFSRRCRVSRRPRRRYQSATDTTTGRGLVRVSRATRTGRERGFCGVCKCLRKHALCAIGQGMAFIVLRRSRNTRSYYLVESYRDDQGKTQRRTLCYLGREQDGTDTLAKALAHWEQVMKRAKRELRKARGERRQVIRRRIEATASTHRRDHGAHADPRSG